MPASARPPVLVQTRSGRLIALPGRRIPKAIHQVWVGPNPLPAAAARFADTWRQHHSDWQVQLWTDRNLPHDLRNHHIYAHTEIMAQKADILRHELLNRFGGVYIDVDFECLKSIEPLLHGVAYFYGEELPGRPGTAILGSVPNHPFVQWCLERIPDRWPWNRGHILDETGPDFFARALAGYLGQYESIPFADPLSGMEAGKVLVPRGKPCLHALHPWVVYPYSWNDQWRPEDHPDAYAVHHWHRNWG